MKRLVIAGSLLSVALFAVAATAQAPDIVEQRQNLMKSNGAPMNTVIRMIRGAVAYDAAAATAAMTTLATNADKIPALFPPGSITGKSMALPNIFDNQADFAAKAKAVGDLARAAAAAAPKGLDAFRAAFTPILPACENCHEKYQKPG